MFEQEIVFGILAFGALISLIYFLLRKKKLQDKYIVLEDRVIKVDFSIPHYAIAAVIGQEGNTIKRIEKRTCTKIYIRKDIDMVLQNKICVIVGVSSCVRIAEVLIQKIVEECKDQIVEEYWIPTMMCGHVIGKKGRVIKQVISSSNAIIKIRQTRGLETCIVIKGTMEDVKTAKNCIEKVINGQKEFIMKKRKLKNEDIQTGNENHIVKENLDEWGEPDDDNIGVSVKNSAPLHCQDISPDVLQW